MHIACTTDVKPHEITEQTIQGCGGGREGDAEGGEAAERAGGPVDADGVRGRAGRGDEEQGDLRSREERQRRRRCNPIRLGGRLKMCRPIEFQCMPKENSEDIWLVVINLLHLFIHYLY